MAENWSSRFILLYIFGFNHKSAPIEAREEAFVSIAKPLVALQQITQWDELVTLTTCNRVELITTASNVDKVQQWLNKGQGKAQAANCQQYGYQLHDREALRHIVRVACGLDSMVLGESQILGQMKDAFARAVAAGSIGNYLGHLFAFVFYVAKKIRSTTGISANSVSVAYTAVNLAKSIFADLRKATALLVGAGEAINLVAQHLYDIPVQNIFIANRTLEKSEALANQIGAQAIRIGDIPQVLARVDVVITSTASQLPILGKGLFERVAKMRKHKPMFVVDLAMPRDVESEVGKLDDVYLYNIDDLQNVVQENLQHRQRAAKQAEKIIDVEIEHFLCWQNSLTSVPAICAYRQKMEQMRDQQLAKARKALQQGKDKDTVLQSLAYDLTQKFMHAPTVEMRRASYHGRFNLLEWAKQLLQVK